jgi:hypothetical protein
MLWGVVGTAPALLQLASLIHYLRPHSLDGKFQTFAAVNAIGTGVPFRDFPVYLGLLVTGFIKALTWLTGDDFVGTQAASILAINICFLFTVLTFSKLANLPSKLWLATLTISTAFVLAYQASWPLALRVLANPVNSVPGVRQFAITVAALVTLWLGRIDGSRPRLLFLRAIAFGAAAGVLSLWSNDFGIAAAMTLLCVPVAISLLGSRSLQNLAICLIATPLAAFASFSFTLLLFGSTPDDWFQSNVRNIAGTQFWLFGPWVDWAHVYSISDLLRMSIGVRLLHDMPANGSAILAASLVHVASVVRFVLRPRHRSPESLALIVVSLASWSGALIATTGGHFEPHYWAMFAFSAPFVGASMRKSFSSETTRMVPLNRLAMVCAIFWISGIAILLFAPFRLWSGPILAGRANIYVPQLRASLAPVEALEFERLTEVRARLDQCHKDPRARVIEAYPSLVSVALGARSSSVYQSVIAVLGTSSERDFASYLELAQPALATTVAPDYSVWVSWNMRARWFWYRALYSSGYRPVARSNQQIIWTRDKVAGLKDEPGACTINKLSQDTALLTVSPIVGRSGPVTAVFKIDYAASPRPAGLATPLQTFVRVTELEAIPMAQPIPPEERYLSYGIPSKAASLELVVPTKDGNRATLLVEAAPASRAALEVKSCQAYFINLDLYPTLPRIDDNNITNDLVASCPK